MKNGDSVGFLDSYRSFSIYLLSNDRYRKGAPGQEKKTACIYRHSTKNESGRLEVNEFRGRLDVAGEENMLHLRGKHRRLMNGTLRKLKGD